MNKNNMITLFFDDGGVLNQPEKREAEWRRLISDWFVPRYGGDPKKWREANTVADRKFMQVLQNQLEKEELVNVQQFSDNQDFVWLQTLFKHAQVADKLPPIKDQLSVVKDAKKWILPKIQAAYDGISEVIKFLGQKYGQLNMASNDLSYHLDLYLQGMGIRHHFSKLYGSDLVDSFKSSIVYYENLLNDMNLIDNPSTAIFVEDHPKAIKYIKKLGAIPIQSRFTPRYEITTKFVVDYPYQLPRIIDEIMLVE